MKVLAELALREYVVDEISPILELAVLAGHLSEAWPKWALAAWNPALTHLLAFGAACPRQLGFGASCQRLLVFGAACLRQLGFGASC